MRAPHPSSRQHAGATASVALVVVLLAFSSLSGCGDDGSTGAADGTTTTAEATTTTTPDDGTATAISPDVRAFALWPDTAGDTRFDDPVDAARSFAVDLAGFTDPVLGDFQQGDSRSGEVEVRPTLDGPVSTVLVRQLVPGDDSWWVIGAVNEDIVIEDPQPQSGVDHPLLVSGRARAFEGTVQVAVYADGSTEPIGEGVVTGSGGSELGPFEGEIPIDVPPGGWGALVLYTESAEDGRVWAVSAVRIGFIGGD